MAFKGRSDELGNNFLCITLTLEGGIYSRQYMGLIYGPGLMGQHTHTPTQPCSLNYRHI
jgi:hypothetical protein